MPSSSTHLNLETARPSLDELVTEYDNWRGTLGYDTDEFSAITKLTALYRFAITHYDQPGAELLVASDLIPPSRRACFWAYITHGRPG